MTRGVIVLRCVADFLGSHPTLPAISSMELTWSQADLVWSVSVHLYDVTAGDMERWASVLDDAVTAGAEKTTRYIREHTLFEVTGTVHGHPVTVWTAIPRTPR
ncbi:hypothetical protein [Embleya sp. NPDC005971]|uniref:hypothetical protein n=1 Tax=Embleya sp. NPDC005971 TaxID=3156724 RepID=UPI0033E38ACC